MKILSNTEVLMVSGGCDCQKNTRGAFVSFVGFYNFFAGAQMMWGNPAIGLGMAGVEAVFLVGALGGSLLMGNSIVDSNQVIEVPAS